MGRLRGWVKLFCHDITVYDTYKTWIQDLLGTFLSFCFIDTKNHKPLSVPPPHKRTPALGSAPPQTQHTRRQPHPTQVPALVHTATGTHTCPPAVQRPQASAPYSTAGGLPNESPCGHRSQTEPGPQHCCQHSPPRHPGAGLLTAAGACDPPTLPGPPCTRISEPGRQKNVEINLHISTYLSPKIR